MDQTKINNLCRAYYECAQRERGEMPWIPDGKKSPWKQLRRCTAEVLETPGYYLLRSYNTVVAVICKGNGICFDVLRTVYGYTATSAQHIAKFAHDYDAEERFTYRPL